MADPGIAISGLVHRHRGEKVLDVAHWQLAAGEQAVVVGPSGSGKTTLLSILAALMPPTEGSVQIAGVDLVALQSRGGHEADRFRSRHIGLVPQQPMLFGVLDAVENVMAARHFAGLDTDRADAVDLLAAVGLQGLERRRPAQLSRGQQQRVALARAFANRPSLILADEPTANLDDERTEQVLALLCDRSREQGATLLVATHDARVRARFGRVLQLDAHGVAGLAGMAGTAGVAR
jgi:putative ABC transport system ATP-binding protein